MAANQEHATEDLIGLSDEDTQASIQKNRKSISYPTNLLDDLGQHAATPPENVDSIVRGGTSNLRNSLADERRKPESELIRQKKMEEDFGRQRKAFMTQMLQMEGEINQVKVVLSEREKECEDLKVGLKIKEMEVEDLRAAAAVSESALKDIFDKEKKELKEEIATLKEIMKVTTEDRNEFNQHTLQRERANWAVERQHLQTEIGQLRMQQPQPQQQQYPYSTPAFHTTGYGAPQPNVQPFSSQPGYQWHGNVPQPPTAANLSPTPPGPHLEQPETLEKHMEKAQAETERLRAVVIPLEEEINLLKGKLQDAELRLRSYESGGSAGQLIDFASDDELLDRPKSVDTDMPRQETPKNDQQSLESGDTSQKELQKEPQVTSQGSSEDKGKPQKTKKSKLQRDLERERSLRNDIEIKLDVMTMQRNVLQEDLDQASQEIGMLQSQLLSQEESKNELRKTWELANLQFVELQQQYKVQLDKLKQQLKKTQSGSQLESLQSSTVEGVNNELSVEKPLGSEEGSDGIAQSVELTTMFSSSTEPITLPDNVSSLDTLLSQMSVVRKEMMEAQSKHDKVKGQLREKQMEFDTLLTAKDKELEKIYSEISTYRTALAEEQNSRKTLETQFYKLNDQMKTIVTTFDKSTQSTNQTFKELKDRFSDLKRDTQEEILRVSRDRQSLWNKVDATREEYACLKEQHQREMEEQEKKLMKARDSQKEAEANVATTFEQLNITQSQLEKEKETLLTEVTSLRSQLQEESKMRGQLHHKYEQLAEQMGDGTRGLDLEGDVALDTLTDGATELQGNSQQNEQGLESLL